MGIAGITVNRLTRKENRQLEDFISLHAEEIKSGKWTIKSLADLASRRLGRLVTSGNLKAAANVMGVVFSNSSPKIGCSLFQLRACVKLLAKELFDLKKEMGLVCSPILEQLANDNYESESGVSDTQGIQ
jgi:hypothetical protein